MIKDFFSLAFQNLRKRGLRSWLTILGIFIGIAAVVALISLGAGLQAAITGQFGGLSVDTLTIQNKGTGFGPPGSTVIEKLNKNDLDIIKNIRGIDKTITRVIRVVNMEYNEISDFGYVADIPDEEELIKIIYESFNVEPEKGEFLDSKDNGKILLGNYFLETDKFEKEILVGKSFLINGQKFEIAGILDKSSNMMMNNAILMLNDDLEELLEIKEEYDLIVVIVEDKNKIEEVAKEIEKKLRDDRDEKQGEESFSVETPLKILESVNNILNIINAIVIGIAMISLIVGGVGIANTMYTSVVERNKEIGIMKAIGAKNSDILWIFLIESGLLGLVGGIIGALIGLGGAIGVSQIANQALRSDLFIVRADYILLTGSILFSFVIGILSGILPALQASKLNVVDAIRGNK
ncbi:MAG: ABC transporter permease [Nanoarchaeota archaeon]|nr:ABC transporter permease [Nanoarchaeota archaeon]MBU4116166.1 ABC transporter permease [Nanoarchaeota archaeon]